MQNDIRDYLYQKATKKLIPLYCLFGLTFNCNLNCIHCYVIKQRNREELTKNEIFNILDQLADAGCLYLVFSGGEPLLRNDFFDIASYAKDKNFALKLFTNGTLINESIADRIKKINFVTVEISLYGFKDTHEAITKVKGSFNKTVKAIKLLVDRKIKVLTKASLMRQNAEELWRLKEFVQNLGAKMRIGNLLFPCDNGNRRPLKYRLTDNQLRAYFQEEFKHRFSGFKLKKFKKNESLCGAGFRGCTINPYGDLDPCVGIRLKKNNNLKEMPFIEVWKGHPEIKKLRNLRQIDRKECWDCEFQSYCFICPAIALQEEGSLLAKLPEACRQARIRKEVYTRLKDINEEERR
ncbi:MAG: radical SAM protein [Candidatus Omnitrophica bacterium]|nr:radical SAM protein [Candidatus Omnitrophota bacterium]